MNEKDAITNVVGIASLIGALGIGGVALWKYLPVFLSRLKDTETANVASAKVSESAEKMLEVMQKRVEALQKQIETLELRITNKDATILTLENRLEILGSQTLDMKVKMSDPHLAETNKRQGAEIEKLREALVKAEIKIGELQAELKKSRNDDYIPISAD
jgi:predicted RNase H-like nuclease (RuvC/YqgF family)